MIVYIFRGRLYADCRLFSFICGSVSHCDLSRFLKISVHLNSTDFVWLPPKLRINLCEEKCENVCAWAQPGRGCDMNAYFLRLYVKQTFPISHFHEVFHFPFRGATNFFDKSFGWCTSIYRWNGLGGGIGGMWIYLDWESCILILRKIHFHLVSRRSRLVGWQLLHSNFIHST